LEFVLWNSVNKVVSVPWVHCRRQSSHHWILLYLCTAFINNSYMAAMSTYQVEQQCHLVYVSKT